MTNCFCCGKEVDNSIGSQMKGRVREVSDPLRQTGARSSCFICSDCCHIVGIKGMLNAATFTKKKCIEIYEQKTGKYSFAKQQEVDIKSNLEEASNKLEKGNYNNSDVIIEVSGARGRHLKIYNDRAVISTRVTVGSVLTGNMTDGEKTIYYSDVIGVQYKKSGLTIGYLQFETASGLTNHAKSDFFNENSFTFEPSTATNETMDSVYAFVQERVAFYKNSGNVQQASTNSSLDEIKKLKELLDIGAISQEEFDLKKKELLNL